MIKLHYFIKRSLCNLQSQILTLVQSTFVFHKENPSESVSRFYLKCCIVFFRRASPPTLAFILLSRENRLISPRICALSVSTILHRLIYASCLCLIFSISLYFCSAAKVNLNASLSRSQILPSILNVSALSLHIQNFHFNSFILFLCSLLSTTQDSWVNFSSYFESTEAILELTSCSRRLNE